MTETLRDTLTNAEYLKKSPQEEPQAFFNTLRKTITEKGYTIVDEDADRPWGAFFRFANEDTEKFLTEFFPGDVVSGDVSPKILVALEGRRLSLQTHERRAEKWLMITRGKVVRGMDSDNLHECVAEVGEILQFEAGEIHRLCGDDSQVTLVAEQWQHTNPDNPSDEEDIIRLKDDYSR
jgi:mannose-6-phosphate isomerase